MHYAPVASEPSEGALTNVHTFKTIDLPAIQLTKGVAQLFETPCESADNSLLGG